MRTTRTYVRLGISEAALAEIPTKLAGAGYSHAFEKKADGSLLIDMHGIAVELEEEPAPPALLTSLGNYVAGIKDLLLEDLEP